jgi:hypothetical protein
MPDRDPDTTVILGFDAITLPPSVSFSGLPIALLVH